MRKWEQSNVKYATLSQKNKATAHNQLVESVS